MTKAGDLYGQSLYELAVSEGLEDKIYREMEVVKGIFDANPDYITLLVEPSIPKRERLGLLDKAFGDSIHEYLLSFIKILVERGMLRSFSSCFKRYRASYNSAHGIAEGLVLSAVKLDKKYLDELTKKLGKMTKKKVTLTQKVDPKVLGGIRIELEGKLYDGTVQGRLSGIRQVMNETL